MGVTLGGLATVDPRAVKRQCDERKPPLPTDEWWGKANSFKWALGPEAGTGTVLMSRRTADTLNLNATADLVFNDSRPDSTFTLKGLVVTGRRCATPGVRDDKAAHTIVTVADRRQMLARIPVDKAYNLRKTDGSDYFTATKNSGTAWTWQGMVNDLCATLGIPNVTLPYTPHGTPENWNFYGAYAWRALNTILTKLSCAARWDPATDAIDAVELGAADAAATAALDAADRYRDWDWEPAGLTLAKVDAATKVRFSRLPRPGDGTTPYYTSSQAAPGTVATATATNSGKVLPDDLSALCDEDNAVTNTSDLDARAAERSTKHYQMLAAGAVNPLARRFVGVHTAAGLKPGKQLWGMAVYDFGGVRRAGGCHTEVIRAMGVVPGFDYEPPAAWTPSASDTPETCIPIDDILECVNGQLANLDARIKFSPDEGISLIDAAGNPIGSNTCD